MSNFLGDRRSPPGPPAIGGDKLLYLESDKNLRLMGGSTLQATYDGGDGITPGTRVTRAFGKYQVPVLTANQASNLLARPGMMVYTTSTNGTFGSARKVYVCTAGGTTPTWELITSS